MNEFGERYFQRAKRDGGICDLCLGEFCAGDTLWPIDNINKHVKKKQVYVHLDCAISKAGGKDKLTPPTCKHWAKRGVCAFGDACFFSHQASKKMIEDDSSAAAAAAGSSSSNSNQIKNSNPAKVKKRKPVANDSRAFAFRVFLIDTFGLDQMKQGSGVLDVGGGHGELAFQIMNLNKIPATVVDPRPLRLRRFARRASFGMYTKNLMFNKYNHHDYVAGCTIPPQQLKSPSHLRVLFQQYDSAATGRTKRKEAPRVSAANPTGSIPSSDPISAGSGSSGGDGGGGGTLNSEVLLEALVNPDSFSQALKEAENKAWTRKGLHEKSSLENEGSGAHEEDDDDEDEGGEENQRKEKEQVEIEQMQKGNPNGNLNMEKVEFEKTEDEIIDEICERLSSPSSTGSSNMSYEKAHHIIKDASLVVGLHPDQAASEIVAFATKFNKPFAVIPCCTYSREFPFRRLHRKSSKGSSSTSTTIKGYTQKDIDQEIKEANIVNDEESGDDTETETSSKLVTSYDDLVEWCLKNGPPGTRVKTLDFEGKNKVVYWKPEFLPSLKQPTKFEAVESQPLIEKEKEDKGFDGGVTSSLKFHVKTTQTSHNLLAGFPSPFCQVIKHECANTSLPLVTCEGSHYDLGLCLGKQAKYVFDHNIKTSSDWELVRKYRTTQFSKAFKVLLDNCKVHFPKYMDEVKGMAVSLDISVEEVFGWQCRVELFRLAQSLDLCVPEGFTDSGCTTVLFSSPSASTTVIGHNEDGSREHQPHCFLLKFTPSSSSSSSASSAIHSPTTTATTSLTKHTESVGFISFCYPLSIPGNTFAINDYGVVQTINNVRILSAISPSIPRLFYARRVLDCASAELAMKLLSQPLFDSCIGFSAYHHTIAQQQQHCAIKKKTISRNGGGGEDCVDPKELDDKKDSSCSMSFYSIECALMDVSVKPITTESLSGHANHLIHGPLRQNLHHMEEEEEEESQMIDNVKKQNQCITRSSQARQDRTEELIEKACNTSNFENIKTARAKTTDTAEQVPLDDDKVVDFIGDSPKSSSAKASELNCLARDILHDTKNSSLPIFRTQLNDPDAENTIATCIFTWSLPPKGQTRVLPLSSSALFPSCTIFSGTNSDLTYEFV